MNEIKLITDEDVKAILDMKNTLRCVEKAYRQKAIQRAYILPIVSADLIHKKADMDIKSGVYPLGNIYGLKLVSWFGENEERNLPALTGMLMIFDLTNGFPKAIINARYLTAMRTGAAGAIGIKYLANRFAKSIVVVGTGHQAVYQIAAALSAVQTIEKVYLYNPHSIQKAKTVQDSMVSKLMEIQNDISDQDSKKWQERIDKVTFLVTDNLKAVLQEVDAVITITPSDKALIQREWVKEGTHFSCIGADLPGKQEIDERIVENAKVFTDDVAQASKVGEIQTAIGLGLLQKEMIKEIGIVMDDGNMGRTSEKDITIFDSTGIALQDLAVAEYVLSIAEEKNIGRNVQI